MFHVRPNSHSTRLDCLKPGIPASHLLQHNSNSNYNYNSSKTTAAAATTATTSNDNGNMDDNGDDDDDKAAYNARRTRVMYESEGG